MKNCYLPLNIALWGIFVCLFGALISTPAQAQIWDKMTKPQVTVNLNHPPRLGQAFKKVALGPANGKCSDEILDQLSHTLTSGGIEVLDQSHFTTALSQQNFTLPEQFDATSAIQIGKVVGPSALVLVKITQCTIEQHRDYTDDKNSKGATERTYNAITQAHLQGTYQTIDLATGKIYSPSALIVDPLLKNSLIAGTPEFPSEKTVHEKAIQQATETISSLFVKWSEQKLLFFYNDKDCKLASAYALLKKNDLKGTLDQSKLNLDLCRATATGKGNTLAHAYYNLGLAYLLVDDYDNALTYLGESEKLKGGEIVARTILEANYSARLNAELQRNTILTPQPAPTPVISTPSVMTPPAVAAPVVAAPTPSAAPAPAHAKIVTGTVEERLERLNELYKKGLITKEDFDAKKQEILKEL